MRFEGKTARFGENDVKLLVDPVTALERAIAAAEANKQGDASLLDNARAQVQQLGRAGAEKRLHDALAAAEAAIADPLRAAAAA